MKKSLSDLRYFNYKGERICYHGTETLLVGAPGKQIVRKIFLQDDWLFDCEYRFNTEVNFNRQLGQYGISVPAIIHVDPNKRAIDYQYLPNAVSTRTIINDTNRQKILKSFLSSMDKLKSINRTEITTIDYGKHFIEHEFAFVEHKLKTNGLLVSTLLADLKDLLVRELNNDDYIPGDYDCIWGNSLWHQQAIYFTDFEWGIWLPLERIIANIDEISDVDKFKIESINPTLLTLFLLIRKLHTGNVSSDDIEFLKSYLPNVSFWSSLESM